jgi:glycosyltransferase involved in cell wall biosynthesis
MKVWVIGATAFTHNGFGNQLHFLCRGLGLGGHQVTQIGMHRPQEAATYVWETPTGDVLQAEWPTDLSEYGMKKLYKIVPHAIGKPGEAPEPWLLGAKMLEMMLQRDRPDVVVTLHDTQNMLWMANAATTLNLKWVHWMPYDNKKWEPEITPMILNGQCNLVMMSDFAEQLVRENRVPYLGKIYHGVDRRIYQPLDKTETRESLNFTPKDKFWVGYIGQNEERKHNDILIKAFAAFAKNKEDVRLYMHTDMFEMFPAHYSYEIIKLAEINDIEEKFRHTPKDLWVHKFSERTMAKMYNCMDVLASSTTGEGFGLQTLYGNACGVPSIITDNTTAPQLTLNGECGWLVPEAAEYIAPGGYTRSVVKYDDMAAMMQDAYKDRDKLARFGQKGLEMSAQYDADLIGKQWSDLITKLGQKN